MKKAFLIFLSFAIVFSNALAIPASAIIDDHGGSPIWWHHQIRIDGGVDELVEYIENEGWNELSWYDSSDEELHIKYLKRMNHELYLPKGYDKDDIEFIIIDIKSVWIWLNDESYFTYAFVDLDENTSDEKLPDEPLDTPFRFDLWTQGTKKMGIEAYNIFKGDSTIALDVDDPVECGDVETIPAFS